MATMESAAELMGAAEQFIEAILTGRPDAAAIRAQRAAGDLHFHVDLSVDLSERRRIVLVATQAGHGQLVYLEYVSPRDRLALLENQATPFVMQVEYSKDPHRGRPTQGWFSRGPERAQSKVEAILRAAVSEICAR